MNLKQWNKAQVLLYYNWLKQQKVLSDLSLFIPYISKKFQSPIHLQPLVDELNDILSGGNNKLIAVSIPPRHGKTETLLHFIALYLKTHPNSTIAYCSYAQTISESKTLNCFDYCKSAGLESSDDMANRKEHRFKNGSRLLTTSVGGRIEGEGVDVFIIDDPYHDIAAAESRVQRESIKNWFESVAEHRLNPYGSIIVCMHRWHLDDLVGWLLRERPTCKYIRLPALDENENPLWASVWTKELILAKRDEKNKRIFLTEYQGIPLADEDRLFRDVYHYESLPEGVAYNIAVDLAYSTDRRSDYSVCVVFARGQDKKRYLIDVIRWQSDITESVEKLKSIQDKYHRTICVEANGVQKAIADLLEKYQIKIKRVMPVTDKLARARNYIDNWNQGNILVPQQASWLNDYLNELYDFTGINDLHDDQVDASVYAFDDSIAPTFKIRTLD